MPAMTHKVWLEVALNGPWSRKFQPGIPDTVAAIVAEGIACAEEGACIVHVHAYDDGGPQTFDWQVYARIIEGIRARIDVPVYPSLPSAAIGVGNETPDPVPRFAHVEELARRGLLEFAVVDPGSVNFIARAGDAAPSVYTNPAAHIVHGLGFAVRHGFHPAYAIYEPGFTRTGAVLAKRAGAPLPVYRFMFSDGFAWGFPPRTHHLEAHVRLLSEEQPGAPWMVAGLDVDIRPLIAPAVALCGHVRVGLEDAPLGTELTNLQWTREAVRAISAARGTLATSADMRAMLRAHPAA
jgi:uncharacterized protein (DUF849 family)